MKLHVWSNNDGLYLSRPPKPSTLKEVEFDPDQKCRQCGETVLSISADNSNICPWCESSMNRPKMLRYQELKIVDLLKTQSDNNKETQAPRRKLIGNRYTERELRDYLTENGYFGNSATFLKLELAGIERPGWVQLFEFHVQAKSQSGEWKELFGVCRSDERFKTFEVNLYDHAGSQQQAISRQPQQMITRDRGDRHWSHGPLMGLFCLVAGLAIVGAIIELISKSS